MNQFNMTTTPIVTDVWSGQIEDRFHNLKHFYLVQFSRHPQNLMHAVLTENQLLLPKNNDPFSSDILINDGQQITPGKLLFVHDDKDLVYTEFQKLKYWSFQKGFDEYDTTTTIGPNTWILVLYTCHEANVVYTIINNSETFQGIRNPYADVICYLNFGDNVYQAIIIRKSENYNEILETLTEIKTSCSKLQFPLKHESYFDTDNSVPPPGFQSFCGTVDEFLQKSNCNNYANADASLMMLEEKMKTDALLLLDWVNALENVKKQAEDYKNYSHEVQHIPSLMEFPNDLRNKNNI